jgi:hypothetical protein
MATTREKVLALIDAVRSLPPEEASPDTRDMVEAVQIANAFGIDLVAMLVPSSDAETDVMVDKLIGLLFEVRGDDLPPWDASRYGEAELDAAGADG